MLSRASLALGLTLVACSPSTSTTMDTSIPDAGTDAWQHVDAWALDAGPPERRGYVVSTFVLPTTSASLADVSLDLNADAARDNALGQLLVSLAQQNVGFQGVATANIDDGSAILLVDALAPSFVNGSVTGHLFEGTNPMPTPCTMPTDPTTCRQHLSGTGHFTAQPPTTPALLGGTIGDASMRLAGSTSTIPLPFFSPPIWVQADLIDVRADVDATGLMHGILAGAIRDTDVQNVVMPALHDYIVSIVTRDCPTATTCASGSLGASFEQFFDSDMDGTITLDEVRNNGLINSVLHSDLDLYDAMGMPGQDGTFESLSFGFGFTAVLATFDAP